MSLFSSGNTVAFWSLYSFFRMLMQSCSTPQDLRTPQMDLWVMESNAFMKSIVAVHILILHPWHFWSIILYVATESRLVFRLDLVKSWI